MHKPRFILHIDLDAFYPRDAQRDKLKQSEKNQPVSDAVWSKSRGKRQRLVYIDTEGRTGPTVPRKETPSVTSRQAVASRAKPKERAKVTGRPWSVRTSLGASGGRALQANRSSQDRRQCARFARVKGGEICTGAGEGSAGMELSSRTVWLRTTLSQARRIPQRGQSLQRTGARGGRGGAFP
jgi:hypothetical protein